MSQPNYPNSGFAGTFDDVWIVDGIRTAFADFNGALASVSPIDLGIKVARAVFEKSRVNPADVGTVICGSMAQASFDAYLLPRHIGLYADVPAQVPSTLVQRICGSGFELFRQAADDITRGYADLALCVGTESMSRNPIASYTHRGGFRLGAPVEFKDFLWEALLDPAPGIDMIQTAENLAKKYGISRHAVDEYAARSFACAVAAQQNDYLRGEIVTVANETFSLPGYADRQIRLPSKLAEFSQDNHIRPSPYEVLAKLRPVHGGVQTAGNSAAVVDGAAAALVASGRYLKQHGQRPIARILAAAAVGVPPEIMGIGPVPAIELLLEHSGLKLDQIDRFEINEAQGAQVLAVEQALGLDRSRLNVNGGAIAMGHPLAATGVRLTITLARELQRSNLRYGIASACVGGGQGMALLIENTEKV